MIEFSSQNHNMCHNQSNMLFSQAIEHYNNQESNCIKGRLFGLITAVHAIAMRIVETIATISLTAIDICKSVLTLNKDHFTKQFKKEIPDILCSIIKTFITAFRVIGSVVCPSLIDSTYDRNNIGTFISILRDDNRLNEQEIESLKKEVRETKEKLAEKMVQNAVIKETLVNQKRKQGIFHHLISQWSMKDFLNKFQKDLVDNGAVLDESQLHFFRDLQSVISTENNDFDSTEKSYTVIHGKNSEGHDVYKITEGSNGGFTSKSSLTGLCKQDNYTICVKPSTEQMEGDNITCTRNILFEMDPICAHLFNHQNKENKLKLSHTVESDSEESEIIHNEDESSHDSTVITVSDEQTGHLENGVNVTESLTPTLTSTILSASDVQTGVVRNGELIFGEDTNLSNIETHLQIGNLNTSTATNTTATDTQITVLDTNGLETFEEEKITSDEETDL